MLSPRFQLLCLDIAVVYVSELMMQIPLGLGASSGRIWGRVRDHTLWLALPLAMAVAKTQLLPIHTQSLSWLLGTTAWNVLILQDCLDLKSAKNRSQNLPYSLACRELWLLSQFLYFSVLIHLPDAWLYSPLDALMHRPLRCACVHIECYLNCRCSARCYFKERFLGRYLMLPCFWHHSITSLHI